MATLNFANQFGEISLKAITDCIEVSEASLSSRTDIQKHALSDEDAAKVIQIAGDKGIEIISSLVIFHHTPTTGYVCSVNIKCYCDN